jgi:hypothetical protein
LLCRVFASGRSAVQAVFLTLHVFDGNVMNLLYDSNSNSINQMKSGLLGRGPWKVHFPEKPSLAAAMALRL